MIGVSFAAATEFRSNGKIITGPLPWNPAWVDNALDQDDLYVEMTFADVLDRQGLDAKPEDFGAAFRDSKYRLWHANAAARRNLAAGIPATQSGHPRHNVHANDIDFQIEADFIGLMAPGLPNEAVTYGQRIGQLMNYGDGIYGGIFVAAMYSAAFFESDPRRVVEAGLATIPAESQYARTIRDVLDWSRQYPDDWKKTWRAIEQKWGQVESCPDGTLRPFNIEASLNGAYVALGLLYGQRDFSKTLEIATRAGQDSDCNGSTAAGIVGTILGHDAIPARWKSSLPAVAQRKFAFTNYSFDDIVKSTYERALLLIQRNGGKVDEASVTIARKPATPPALQSWSMGTAVWHADTVHEAWRWSTGWRERSSWDHDLDGIAVSRWGEGAGHEAAAKFTGTAFTLTGEYLNAQGQPWGGVADVFLDGGKIAEIRATIPERTYENVLLHRYGLANQAHELRIVTREGLPGTAQRLVVSRLMVYR